MVCMFISKLQFPMTSVDHPKNVVWLRRVWYKAVTVILSKNTVTEFWHKIPVTDIKFKFP